MVANTLVLAAGLPKAQAEVRWRRVAQCREEGFTGVFNREGRTWDRHKLVPTGGRHGNVSSKWEELDPGELGSCLQEVRDEAERAAMAG